MTRCFVAFDLSDAARAACLDAQALLDESQRKTAAESLHLTIKFLGDVDVETCAKPMFDALGAPPRVRLGAARVTGFPSARRAKIVVLACEGDAALAELAKRADDEGFARGVPRDEHAFTPHVTLARSKSPIDVRRVAKRFGARDLGAPTRFVLYESRAGKYIALAQIPSK